MSSYDQANALLKSLVERYDDGFGLGTMSASIYDTAWVALVSRTVDNKTHWVFPESFDFIYNSQAPDGSWPGDGSVVDSIINTLACLLALKRHEQAGLDDTYIDLSERCDKAIAALNRDLQKWDVASTERIAFEIIVPSIFESLEKDGIKFDFSKRSLLYKLYNLKLKKVNWEIIYEHRTTVLHSLEAFVGKCDFDRLAHHTRSGNLMASPSSTAAYLTHASKWDDESEAYLRHVIEKCKAYGYGSVCNVWPTTVFEFSWSVSNLIESGFEREKLDQPSLDRIGEILHCALTAEKGVIGFAPDVGPDADDTAKAITALRYIGKPFSFDALLKTFELPTHFQCFQFERNPSLSANCNVLIALLRYPEPAKYSSQILKTATFIAQEYWTTEGIVRDKWHVSPWYVALLAAQGLLHFLHLHGQGLFADATLDLISAKLPPVLFTILLRILQSQHEDGSWGVNHNPEETAYCVLALAQLASLPYTSLIRDQIDAAIASGKAYLHTSGMATSAYINPASYIWAGKINYAIEHVCQGYVISALNAPVPTYAPETVSSGAPSISEKRVEYFSEFYFRCPMFKGYPAWRMRAWLIEGYLFIPELTRVRLDVFDRAEMKGDGYFEYLPFSWVGPNGMEETYASPQTIFDMIVISMVNFQMDEFFDIAMQKYGTPALSGLRSIIKSIFAKSNPGEKVPGHVSSKADEFALSSLRSIVRSIFAKSSPGKKVLGHVSKVDGLTVDGPADDETSDAYAEIYARLARFINFIWTYPHIQKASRNDQQQLKYEMFMFLNAHIDQCEDNSRLQAQKSADIFLTPRSSYIKWVRSTASDHLSSHYSFAYFTCLLGHAANRHEDGPGEDYFPGSKIKYIAQDCSTHLSVICRIYNDYGSLKRDKQEKNLNSVLFPEFEGAAKRKSDAELKRELTQISDYERACLKTSLDQLLAIAQEQTGDARGKRIHETVRLFYNASEIYNEVYEIRDLSTWN